MFTIDYCFIFQIVFWILLKLVEVIQIIHSNIFGLINIYINTICWSFRVFDAQRDYRLRHKWWMCLNMTNLKSGNRSLVTECVQITRPEKDVNVRYTTLLKTFANWQHLHQLQSQADWTVFCLSTMVAPTKWNYCAYYSAPVIYGLGGRYTTAMGPYNLDPTDPTAAITPNMLASIISGTSKDGIPTALLLLNAALGSTATTKVGRVKLLHRVRRFWSPVWPYVHPIGQPPLRIVRWSDPWPDRACEFPVEVP